MTNLLKKFYLFIKGIVLFFFWELPGVFLRPMTHFFLHEFFSAWILKPYFGKNKKKYLIDARNIGYISFKGNESYRRKIFEEINPKEKESKIMHWSLAAIQFFICIILPIWKVGQPITLTFILGYFAIPVFVYYCIFIPLLIFFMRRYLKLDSDKIPNLDWLNPAIPKYSNIPYNPSYYFIAIEPNPDYKPKEKRQKRT